MGGPAYICYNLKNGVRTGKPFVLIPRFEEGELVGVDMCLLGKPKFRAVFGVIGERMCPLLPRMKTMKSVSPGPVGSIEKAEFDLDAPSAWEFDLDAELGDGP